MKKQKRGFILSLKSFGALAKVGGTSGTFAAAYIAADSFTLGALSGGVALTGLAGIWSDRKVAEADAEKFREFQTELLNEIRAIRSFVEYVLVVTVSYSAASLLRTISERVDIYWLIAMIVVIAAFIFWPRVDQRAEKTRKTRAPIT